MQVSVHRKDLLEGRVGVRVQHFKGKSPIETASQSGLLTVSQILN